MYVLKRRLRTEFGKLFYSISPSALIKIFRDLGLNRGATVCVHSSLSQLGYVKGGSDSVIEALMETIGDEGCLAMPSFPTAGTMQSYVENEGPFDVRNSPSKVGAITELFRKQADVKRSMHPTHAVAAWGAGADALLRDHEKSNTPYGYETPYGRLADDPESFILMLGTRLLSLPHHLQERVDFPNLFLPGTADARYIDWDGEEHILKTKVMRPKVPYFVAIPPVSGIDPDWCILHDFGLVFPKQRAREVHQLGYKFEGFPKLWERRAFLEQKGILRTRKVGRGEIGLLRTKAFIDLVEPELRDMIDQYRSFYDADFISAMNLPI